MDTSDTPQPMTNADVTASDTATLADVSSSTGGSAPDGASQSDGSGKPDGGGKPGEGDRKPDGAADPTLKQTLSDKTSELKGQAGEKVRQFADDGKARATGALDDLARMLSDAADQLDEKLGGQFGQYARSTADHVQGFSSTLNDKSLDDMLEMGREFIRKSPVAAIGIATALGFVVARLATAGFEQRDQA